MGVSIMSTREAELYTFGGNPEAHPAFQLIGQIVGAGVDCGAALVNWFRKTVSDRKERARLRRLYGDDGAVICELLEDRKLKDSTLRAYIRQIRQFDAWLAKGGYTAIDRETVESYVRSKNPARRGRGENPS